MPNWCHNTLTINGTAKAVTAFVAKAESVRPEAEDVTTKTPLNFDTFVPQPDHVLASLRDRSLGDDWYTWRYDHWDTKWDANFNNEPFIAICAEGADPTTKANRLAIENSDLTGPGAIFQFDTAWGPPTLVIEAIVDQHPELDITFLWGEPGHGTGACTKWVKGEQIEHVEGPATEFLSAEMMWF